MHRITISRAAIEGAKERRDGKLHPFSKIDPAATALLVVDMQTAFVAEDAPFRIPEAREIVGNINRLAVALRQARGTVVWIISTYGPEERDNWPVLFDHIMEGERGRLFRDSLTSGADGHALWHEMQQADEDIVVSKNRFSPFAGPDNRLEALLRSAGIDTVLVAGTVTNVCCESTARDAAMRDFKTIMVADANVARSDEEHNATLATFLQVFGDVLGTEEVLRTIAGRWIPQSQPA